MGAFLVRRLLGLAVVMIAVSFASYSLIGLMPGDPIDVMISSNPDLTPADAERLKQRYGLDQPLVARYLHWAGDILGGDFGYSRTFRVPVWDIILPRLGNTMILLGASFVLSLAIAIPAGVLVSLRPGGAVDYGVNLLCFAGVSIPSFWLALLLMYGFSVHLQWLPPGGGGSVARDGMLGWMSYQVLPVCALTVASLAVYIRHVRAAMGESLAQDYVRTARAKGASTTRVVYRHALRNAMMPVVTIIALDFGTLFSGALVTEQVFSYPGMGRTIYDAIMSNDYNLALAALLLATVAILLANLLADLAYAWLDPRVKLH
ncbi:MAG: ABC transporter permease [Alphaproteobacteria bacterium]